MPNFTQVDLHQFKQKGIDIEKIKKEFYIISKGVEPTEISDVANIENGGIKKLTDERLEFYKNLFEQKKEKTIITKFVPASGAATRMFKSLFEFLNNNEKISEQIDFMMTDIREMALFDDLKETLKKDNLDIDDLLQKKDYIKIVEYILYPKGLNYASLPKALVKFHKYEEYSRTAFEEHLAEASIYAVSNNYANLHFTVSPEHYDLFKELEEKVKSFYENLYKIKFKIEYSEQESFTDSISLTPDNEFIRDENGKILFRPGGHGSLIYNLNRLDSDLVFIKNIDNVVPDQKRSIDILYKKALAGFLLETQQKIFDYIKLLNQNPSDQSLDEIYNFVANELSIRMNFDFDSLYRGDKIDFLQVILDRPLRVCGMVKNEGEPGGGPFFSKVTNKYDSLQIVEKSQINLDDTKYKEIFDKSTHFNPVDIVFSAKRYTGEKFDLLNYVNKNGGFIVEKNYNGRPLKSYENPGLWNGSMAFWNSVFVEVPIETFNPVKTIFDLLRKNHASNCLSAIYNMKDQFKNL